MPAVASPRVPCDDLAMNRALGGAAGVLTAGVLFSLCTACGSAKDGQASAAGGGAETSAAGANAGNAGHGGASAGTDGNGASGSPNGGTPNARGGRSGGTGGTQSSNAGAGASAGANSISACQAESVDAHAVPLDLLIMLDTSASMLDATSTQKTKWDAVKGALEAFLQEDASAGVGVGLQYFPLQKPNVPDSCSSDADCGDSGPCYLKYCSNSSNLSPCEVEADCQTSTGASAGPCLPIAYCSKNQEYMCTSPGSTCQTSGVSQDLGVCQKATASVCEHPASCDVAQYALPTVAISALPDAAAGLIASIDGKQPSGDTPTGPALSGALQQAKTWATAHLDHRVATVLVTDGLPNECSPSAAGELAALAKASVTSSPSINTFVIGVFGAADMTTSAPDTVNQIAQQGGTDHAFVVDTTADVAAQVQAALEAIGASGPDCEFQIPLSPGGGALDAGKVNVTLGTTQSQIVRHVFDASACDPVAGGWYYELDGGSQSQIAVCPVTCSAAKSGTPVKILLGCATLF
jgi:Mg-chelatase subunit ChlD